MAFNTSSVGRVKNYFLKGVLAIYAIAFTSLYIQVQSLFGDSGVVPLSDYASKINASKQNFLDAYNIILLAPQFGLSYATFLELLCLFSVVITQVALRYTRLANALTFGLLWYLYYSICGVGQGFMSFHSDLLLLEVGFIAILLAPLLPAPKLSQSDHDHVTCFLVKWIVFRYFVTNVLNVYLDGDKAWYSMTAIPMVAQGVQFPSIFSWRIFNLSPDIIKVYQAYEHAVKLCAPFLLLFDLKYSRLMGFYSLLFIAGPSALFFNFGWTDLLISICLLSFLKDAYFYSDKRAKQSGLRSLFDMIVLSTYLAAVTGILIKFYGFKYDNGTIKAQVTFTPAQFKLFVDHFVPASLALGLLGLLGSTYTSLFASSRKTSFIKTLVYTVIATGLFFSTFPNLTRFSPATENRLKPISPISKETSKFVAPYLLSNNYILLSKVSQHYGEGRPELHIQGRESADVPTWEQFDLKYKPGHPSTELSRVVPHLPRIELKMWYAARSSLQNNQWLQTLVYRIATKSKSMSDVLGPRSSNSPSKLGQVRVALHNLKHSSSSKQPFAGYWSQSNMVSEYMPTTTLENLKFVVKSNGISLTQTAKPTSDSKAKTFSQVIDHYLDVLSQFVRGTHHTAFIWSVTAISFLAFFRR